MSYGPVIPSLWLVWFVVWMILAHGVKAAAERESNASRLAYVVPLLVAVALLGAPDVPLYPLNARFVPPEMRFVRLGAALTFAGLAVAVWARL